LSVHCIHPSQTSTGRIECSVHLVVGVHHSTYEIFRDT
jgi:hypothetical protein